jgi:hypothetical protein
LKLRLALLEKRQTITTTKRLGASKNETIIAVVL